MKLQLNHNTPSIIFGMVQALEGQSIAEVKMLDVVALSETCSIGTGVRPSFLRESFVKYVQQQLSEVQNEQAKS